MTSRDEWRWTDEQGVQRLVRTEELREAIASRVLPPSVLVWREGMAEWVPAFTVPAFADALPTAEEPLPEPPPRFGASPPEKRGQLSTLLGITGPAAPQKGTQGAPIVVPSGAGADAAPPGGAPITLRPEYGGAAFENAAALPRGPSASPEPPAAVRPPPPVASAAPVAAPPRVAAPPPRAPTSSGIDALWSDDETTNVGELAPGAAKPPQKEATAASPLKPAAVVLPRANEGTPKPAVVGPIKPAVEPRGKAGAGTENTSIGALPKAPVGPKASELSTVGPSPVRAPSKILTKPGPSPTLPKPFADKDKPSAILRPSALLKPIGAPRAGVSPSTPPPAKVAPSTPPPALVAPAAAVRPAALPVEPLVAAALPPPVAAEAPLAPPPELAPVTAPSRIEELPPAPPPREPSTTAILPPDLTVGYTGPSMAGAVKLSHEVSRTIRIEGLLSDPTTSPLPDKDREAIAGGSSDAPPTSPSPRVDGTPRGVLPSEVNAAEYPPAASFRAQALGEANAGRSQPFTYTETPRGRAALDATSDGRRAAALEQAPSNLPMKAIATSSGILVAMVISAFFVGRCSVKPTVAGGGARSALTNTVREIRDALPQPPKPCWVAKQPVRWAPVVSNKVPFELLPLATGNVSIGYAKSSDEAVGIEITPSSGQVNEGFVDRISGEIDRVAPTGVDKGYFVAAKESSGTLKSVVPVPAATPFFVGLAEGNLATADSAEAAAQALWPISGSDPLDAARVIITNDKGYAVSFRRDGAVMGGFIGPDRKPVGEIVKVAGSGGQVGKPMSGWNGREVAILFADRADDQSPWKIRLGHAPPGSIPASTEVIELPAGGPGGDAFAPGIAGLPDGRWVLIWTEGSSGARAVRAQTLGPDFVPVGDPIALSPPAGNFGQGMAAVAGAYVTAVFLQRGKSSYELWGGVLQCG